MRPGIDGLRAVEPEPPGAGSDASSRKTDPAPGPWPGMKPRLSPRPVWRPLVDPEGDDRVLRAVQEIAGCLRTDHAPRSVDATLGDGAAGLAVLFAYLSRALGIDRYAEESARYWRRAVDALETEPLSPGLIHGFCGIAWVTAYLEQGALAATDVDRHTAIEDALLEYIPDIARRDGLELVGGLVGCGLYALERWPASSARRGLDEILDVLREAATVDEAGTHWPTVPPDGCTDWRAAHPEGYDDLGLAHGHAGIVGFLAACAARGVPHAESTLRSAVHWLLAQRCEKADGFEYPTLSSPERGPEGGRLAWCYGDLATASSLSLAADALDEPAWRHEALRVARAAPRREKSEARNGAGGAAGCSKSTSATCPPRPDDRAGRVGMRDVGGDEGFFMTRYLLDEGRVGRAPLACLTRTAHSPPGSFPGIPGFPPWRPACSS